MIQHDQRKFHKDIVHWHLDSLRKLVIRFSNVYKQLYAFMTIASCLEFAKVGKPKRKSLSYLIAKDV